MGLVYRARDLRDQKEVALKVLLDMDVEAVLRFRREAELASRLDDPGIIPALDIGTEGGTHYYAMELCSGQSLEARLREGPLPVDEARALLASLAATLAVTHGAGIIHRDLKPANVMLEGGRPRITDFGLARETGQGESLTQSGTLLGTPAYMPPEQLMDSKRVGPAADVYALGVILYECLTGAAPYVAKGLFDLARQVCEGKFTPPRRLRPEISPQLEQVCLWAMDTDPARRPSAAELSEALRVLPRRGPGRLALQVLAGIVAAGLLVSLASLWLWSDDPAPPAGSAGPNTLAQPGDPEPSGDDEARRLLEEACARAADLAPIEQVQSLLARAEERAQDADLVAEIRLEQLDLLLRRSQFKTLTERSERIELPLRAARRARLLRAFALKRQKRDGEANQLLVRLHAEDDADPTCLNAGAVHSFWSKRQHRGDLIAAALARDPNDIYTGLSRYYQLLLERKDPAAAGAVMTELLTRRPDHGLLLWGLATLRNQQDGPAGASGVFGQLIKLSRPVPHRDAVALQAKLLFDLKRDAEAEALLRETLEFYPEDSLILQLFGMGLVRNRRLEEAREAWKKGFLASPAEFLRVAKQQAPGVQEVIRRYLLQAFRYRPGPPEPGVVTHLTARVQKAPEPARGPLLRAFRAAAGGQSWETYAADCEEALRAAPNSPAVALARVDLLLGRDRHAAAQREIERARSLSLSPEQRLGLFVSEGTLTMRRGRNQEAMVLWRRLAEEDAGGIFGRIAELHLLLGRLNRRAVQDGLVKARALSRDAPDNVEAQILEFVFCMAARPGPLSLYEAEQVLAVQGALDSRVLTLRSQALVSLLLGSKVQEDALAELEAVLALGGSTYHALLALTWLVVGKEEGTYAACERALWQALAREPLSSDLNVLIGSLALRQDKPAATVIAHWRRALEVPSAPALDPFWISEFEEQYGPDQPGWKELIEGQR